MPTIFVDIEFLFMNFTGYCLSLNSFCHGSYILLHKCVVVMMCNCTHYTLLDGR